MLLMLSSVCVAQPRASAGRLHDSLARVAPIDSVSIGRYEDPSTWIVRYRPEATDQQRAAAASIVATWTPAMFGPTPREQREYRFRAELDPLTASAQSLTLMIASEADPALKASYQARLTRVRAQLIVRRKQIEADIPGGDE
jgi:hypothetical protein